MSFHRENQLIESNRAIISLIRYASLWEILITLFFWCASFVATLASEVPYYSHSKWRQYAVGKEWLVSDNITNVNFVCT